jgi:hypothetical protein
MVDKMVTNVDPRTKNVRYLNTAIFLSRRRFRTTVPRPLFALISAVEE